MNQVIIGANLKLLREERRLSLEELSNITNITVERLKELESGQDEVYFSELEVLLPVLKISEEDLITRDLVQERKDALHRMKKSDNRSAYNWYMGDRKSVLFYILAIVIITLSITIACMIDINLISNINEAISKTSNIEDIAVMKDAIRSIIMYSALGIGFVSFIFIIIELLKKRRIRFKYWMIFLISLLPLFFIISFVLTIPFIIYCVYRGIILHGKNR